MPTDPVVLVRLTRALADIDPAEPYPLRLCRAFVSLAEAIGGGISLGISTTERSVLCATDDDVVRFEEAQDVLLQGPSIEALRTQRPVLPTSPADQCGRWPELADSLPQIVTTRLVRAFPMRPHHAVMGVLTIHQWPARDSDSAELDVEATSALADAVGAAILGATESSSDTDRLWGERDRVSQATGMVVAQLGVTPVDAMSVLRAHAFAQETTLARVSALVLERRLDFSDASEAGA